MRRVSFHSKKASKKNSLTLFFHHFYSTPVRTLSLFIHTESLEMATPPVNVSEAIQVRILRRR